MPFPRFPRPSSRPRGRPRLTHVHFCHHRALRPFASTFFLSSLTSLPDPEDARANNASVPARPPPHFQEGQRVCRHEIRARVSTSVTAAVPDGDIAFRGQWGLLPGSGGSFHTKSSVGDRASLACNGALQIVSLVCVCLTALQHRHRPFRLLEQHRLHRNPQAPQNLARRRRGP